MNLQTQQTFSPQDVTWMDGEPRIKDERLGEMMGFSRPRKVRELIRRYLPQIERFGRAHKQRALVPGGLFGQQQEVQVTYLSIKQALFLITKSGAPWASEITIEMVNWYTDHQLAQATAPAQPQLPPPSTPALPPALLRSLAQERLRARPEWRKIRGYARRGFQTGEIAKVMGISSGKVGAALSQMRQLGLIETAGPKHVPA
jgi:hypothetical protein